MKTVIAMAASGLMRKLHHARCGERMLRRRAKRGLPQRRPQVATTRLLAPDLHRDFDDERELVPLLILRKRIALLCRGEAALGGETKLAERGVFLRFVDAAQ